MTQIPLLTQTAILDSPSAIRYITIVYFSCKISNAVLAHLEHRGEDLSRLYEMSLPPMELLRDPSSWLSAPEMESFLESMVQLDWNLPEGALLKEAAHSGPNLRSWGVLDSVLRMMPRPQEIFHQPERFLSYFISPEPPIENLSRTEIEIAFDLPLPADQYPHVTAYLMSAFESLPLYVGQGLARCEWSDIHLRIVWPETQHTMFAEDPGHQVSPDLLRSVVDDHQRLQRELEERNREIQSKDEELRLLRSDLAKFSFAEAEADSPERFLREWAPQEHLPAHRLGQNLARLHDYMVRAQQLITVLTGLSKSNPTVKEALRRLDWDHVKAQYPRTIADSVEALRGLTAKPNTTASLSSPTRTHEENPHV